LRKYNFLKKLGLSDKKINTLAHLLILNQKTIQNNNHFLRNLGIAPQKIVKNWTLLSLSPETIKHKRNFLKNEIGLTDKKITSIAELLGSDQSTIKKNRKFG